MKWFTLSRCRRVTLIAIIFCVVGCVRSSGRPFKRSQLARDEVYEQFVGTWELFRGHASRNDAGEKTIWEVSYDDVNKRIRAEGNDRTFYLLYLIRRQ
jgi:hypothetical protein